MQQERPKSWRRLDNSALLFPAVSNSKDTRVFRFYCELKEAVDPGCLQTALDQTVLRYPIFLSVLRSGLFWHYLENSDLKPMVRQEYKPPCAPLYIKDKKTLLFEVTYYENRINFEVFHSLTDGTGAMEFLKELVEQYLVVRYKVEGALAARPEKEWVTEQDQADDSVTKYYTKAAPKHKRRKMKAFSLKKRVNATGELRVSEGVLSVREVLGKAREMGVSLTVLLTTVMICAIHREMTRQQERRPVVMMVPVNLRNFFPSASMRNFFGWIEPGYQFGQGEEDFQKVLAHVKEHFADNLTKEKMSEHMSGLKAIAVNPFLRFFPRDIKNLGMSAGALFREQDVTAIYSNVGVVKVIPEYEPYIKGFGVYNSTMKLQLCSCSYGDTLTLGFTSRFDTSNIQRNFYQILSELGISSEQKKANYPEHDTPKLTGVKIFKTFTFLCIVAMVIAVAVNVMFTPNSFWALIAIGGIASLWVGISIGYYKRHNLLKDAMWLLVLITCGSMLWDLLTGWKGWSVDFVFPSMSIAVIVAMLVISRIQSHTAREYMIYLLMAAVYSCVIPFILLLVGAVQFIYLSVISAAIGFLMVIGLMLFRWREFREELEKNFHV